MKTVLALVLATAVGARAEEARPAPHHGSDSGLVLLDFFLDVVTLGLEVAAIENAAHAQPPPPQPQMTQRAPAQEEDDLPPRAFRARRPQAREGLLLSFGIGGGSMFVSYPNDGRTGAFDLDMRLGYGFSDRFQLFMDLDLAGAHYAYGDDIGSWAFTLRGQTVLVGDRAGNGLNLNLGIGTGGITVSRGYYDQVSSPSGLALAGGISYDARVSPWFALSPEFFVTWHAIPNGPGRPQDVASVYGVRLNFLWYLH
ncbi:MAG: hypothetical protein ABR567_06375 [Myxococcales bacterium]